MDERAERQMQKERDILDRAKLDEAMAYQRAKDSRAALVAAYDRTMGDVSEQPDYYCGYYWNPYSLRYDIEE